MEFYRAEYMMENLKNWNEKEKEHNKSQEEDQSAGMPKFDQGSLMRDAGKMMGSVGSGFPSMPKMPNFGSLKL